MKKLILIGLSGLLLLLAAWRAAPLYQHFRGTRYLRAAEAADRSRNPEAAGRLFALALHREPTDPTFLHSYAAFLKKFGNADELPIRAWLSQHDPSNDEALLDWVEAAFTYQQPAMARLLLLHCATTPAAKKARFFHLQSMGYFIAGNLPLADAACTQALRLEPANKMFQTNQATIRLAAPSAAVRQQAVAVLELLSHDRDAQRMALDSLLKYAAAIPRAYAAIPPPEPPMLEDWLGRFREITPPESSRFQAYLGALARWRPTSVPAELSAYTSAAAARPDTALVAQEWLTNQGFYKEAVDFFTAHGTVLGQRPESLMICARGLLALNRQAELEELLKDGAWKPPVRLAWQEKLRRLELADEGGATLGRWGKILEAARDDTAILHQLAGLAREWNWPPEYEATLWRLVNGANPDPSDELDQLFKLYTATGSEHNLIKVAERQAALHPDNPALRNNLAYLDFLLGVNTERSEAATLDLSATFDKNPTYIATRAFGWWKAGKLAQAIELFRGVDPFSLRGTPAGVIYGLLLADSGNLAARTYLNDAERWTDLPSERRLVGEARRKLPAMPATEKERAGL